MKKYVIICFLASVWLTVSCSSDNSKVDNKPSKTELKARIKEMEDSLVKLQNNLSTIKKIPNLTHLELINRLLDFYHNYPKDAYAPICLEKVHMKYTGLNIQERAVAYGDTLLKEYPNYENKALILESMGSTYDVFILPRDTTKIRKYYGELLQMKSVPVSKKEEIKFRLDHLDLTFDQLIEMQLQKISTNSR